MKFNSKSIDYLMGYLAGSLYYDWETEDYTLNEFIVKANELIEFNGIPLDIDVAEYVCEIYSSIKGKLKYKEREYVVVDEEQAVYIKDNLIVIEDDKELVEKLNELLDGEDYAFECAECSKKVIRDSEEHDNSGTIDDTDWYCSECFSTKYVEEEDMEC